jgi:hypothetical protein
MKRKPQSVREAGERWLRLSLYKMRKRDKARINGGKTMTEIVKPLHVATIRGHCVAKFDDDEDALRLTFELADDRAVSLTYWKNGDLPFAYIHDRCSCGDLDQYFRTPEEFEDWAKIALNAMSPDRERRWLCQICKERPGFGPMLPNDIWAAIKVVPDPGYSDLMCLECMKKRARQMLGRELVSSGACE